MLYSKSSGSSGENRTGATIKYIRTHAALRGSAAWRLRWPSERISNVEGFAAAATAFLIWILEGEARGQLVDLVVHGRPDQE